MEMKHIPCELITKIKWTEQIINFVNKCTKSFIDVPQLVNLLVHWIALTLQNTFCGALQSFYSFGTLLEVIRTKKSFILCLQNCIYSSK